MGQRDAKVRRSRARRSISRERNSRWSRRRDQYSARKRWAEGIVGDTRRCQLVVKAGENAEKTGLGVRDTGGKEIRGQRCRCRGRDGHNEFRDADLRCHQRRRGSADLKRRAVAQQQGLGERWSRRQARQDRSQGDGRGDCGSARRRSRQLPGYNRLDSLDSILASACFIIRRAGNYQRRQLISSMASSPGNGDVPRKRRSGRRVTADARPKAKTSAEGSIMQRWNEGCYCYRLCDGGSLETAVPRPLAQRHRV